MAEAFRSGLESVEKNQLESGLSIGLSRRQIMSSIIFPQALSVSIPALCANIIFLIKETSVFSVVALADLMYVAKDLIGLYYDTNEALFMPVSYTHLVALVGANGAGKSTLMLAIEGLLEGEGSIFVDGMVLNKENLADIRQRVGMVFQAPSPFPMSIGENIAYGIRLQERLTRRDMDVRIEEALTRAALFDEVKDRLTSDARRLSGGQQQRLCIARCV